jgi:hypothetical protein
MGQRRLDKAFDDAAAKGWTIASMNDNWRRIYAK